MIQIRLHGLGGQGVVLTSQLLGKAALNSGLWANSLPFFTTAQRGGVVTAFTRISKETIGERCFIYEPDYLVIFHSTLLGNPEIFDGVKPETIILLDGKPERINIPVVAEIPIYWLDASNIARRILNGPYTSTTMAGAILRLFDNISFNDLAAAIGDTFPSRHCDKNILAAKAGYDAIAKFQREE
jgi:pyruvate ferredoxin oxidoreductase gamma subunit